MKPNSDMMEEDVSLFAFLTGVGSVFLLTVLSTFIEKPSALTAFMLVSGSYIGAGVIGCRLIPQHPYRAARMVVGGVCIGTVLSVIFFPKLGGYERNLFPVEIVVHTLWAAMCCFLVAALVGPKRKGDGGSNQREQSGRDPE